MNVHVSVVDTPLRKLVWDARHKIHCSTEEFFHHAFEYAHEDVKKGSAVVQEMFIEYLHSGGEIIPPPVIDYAIDILAGRVDI